MKKLTKIIGIICCFVLALMPFGMSKMDDAVFANADTDLAGKGRILIEYGTGEVLDEYNQFEHLPIASVTKLTTLLLAFEAIDEGKLALDKELTASKYASSMGGSQVFIDAGSDYTVENLLHAIIISSANDASVMIAEELAGSEENFVAKMNEKVKALGGQNTNYNNCNGLPSPAAYSCAHDVALVMRELMKYPLYFEISGIWMEDFAHPSGRVTQMANTNKLLRSFDGCDAGKTGSTAEAGYCMSVTAKKAGMRLIAVVLGAENSKERFGTCARMLDYGFSNYSSVCVLDKSAELDLGVEIKKAKELPSISAAHDYYALSKIGENGKIDVAYEMTDLVAPLKKGAVVGQAIVTKDGVVLAEIDLILNADVAEKSYLEHIKSIANNW